MNRANLRKLTLPAAACADGPKGPPVRERERELINVAALCGAARCGRVANKPQTITNDGQGETQIQTKAKQTLPAASAYEIAPKEQTERTRETKREKRKAEW